MPARAAHGLEVNAVRRQVVRNRLVAITDAMRVALQAVSGSPTVTEASDFFTGLYLPDGEFATMGYQVTFEAPPVGALIRVLMDRGTRLSPGDMFVGNDPFIGALHQNDLQMAAPLFDDSGQLVAWAGVMAHQTDMGGMDFASWSPKAREIWQEGLRIPAVKLVDRGELRQDVLEMILAATRLPAQVELDVRAFIATLNTAAERLGALMTRYGMDVVQAVMASMIDASEAALRRRLQELPDGVVRVRDFLEHDGHTDQLYEVALKLTKSGDRLVLDFSGSSPQAPGFINATRAGLNGGVAGAVLPTLGFGIPWNGGLLRPVEVLAPDGLVCTALPPAPVGSATVETVWVVSNVVSAALNRLLACSPRHRERAQAVCSGTMATFNLGGINQFGERFGLHLMDPLAGGFGAFSSRDGLDAGGPLNTPSPSIADVEYNEQVAPLFYLHRRLATDTGGPGRQRGGRGAEIALTLGGISTADALVMTHGLEVPNAVGLGGGLPGGAVRQRLGRRVLHGASPPITGTDGSLPEGDWETLGPKPGAFKLTERDVFAVTWQGGGGYGDPLDRDPEAVAEDVAAGAVSPASARQDYGVVVDAAARVDAAATAEQRRRHRADRLGVTVESLADPGPVAAGTMPAGTLALTGRLLVRRAEDGTFETMTTAGAVLSRGDTGWRAGAVAYALVLPGASGGALHPDLAVTGWVCPASGALLAVDVHRSDAAPGDDLLLDPSYLARVLSLPLEA